MSDPSRLRKNDDGYDKTREPSFKKKNHVVRFDIPAR